MDYSSISIKHKIIHINIVVKVEEIKSTHTFFCTFSIFTTISGITLQLAFVIT